MSEHPIKRRRKLIEVAIPLEAISAASAREKNIRHGHPSTLHLWWARRPLAAARAVIFCKMVDDPSAVPEEFPTEVSQEDERRRLFVLISELVAWKNTTNEEVLNRAREEIKQSWRRCCADNADHPEAAELFNPEKLPGFHDPFAGGGALPLEAQRLGLESYASDLNPVAVLINKAMIEIPPKFAGMAPVNPEARSKKHLIAKEWNGAKGLAEDVRYYGQWMRDEAEKRIGHLYPKVEVTPQMAKERPDLEPHLGQELTVIAWLWARTVKSPNPAFSHVDIPLVTTFMLSTKKGNEAYVEPEINGDEYRFAVRVGRPEDNQRVKSGTSAGKRNAFRCLMSGVPVDYKYIRAEGKAGRMGSRLMAIVAEGARGKGKVYLSPSSEQEQVALTASPAWKPELNFPDKALGIRALNYGLTSYDDLFTQRQTVALSTLVGLVEEARQQLRCDAMAAGMSEQADALRDGGTGATAYAEAVGIYLSFVCSRMADFNSAMCGWIPVVEATRNTFVRQAISLTWDYAEINLFSDWLANYNTGLKKIIHPITDNFRPECDKLGYASQADAHSQSISLGKIISTDPPYYDNVGYAELSDFFYIWLRRTLRGVFPEVFATLAVPKAEELVANPYRHGGKQQAEAFFLDGMTQAMKRMAKQAHPAFPITIYYAFKQSETKGFNETASTGWETFLDAVINAGFSVAGTWPLRTELTSRMNGKGANALASSVVLACRKREANAPVLSRTEFRRKLKAELPAALAELEAANIAPVDVAQAAIGPGMAIYSQAKAVLNPDDSQMGVREALIEINAALDEALSQDEGELDSDSRFALTFFESFGYEERDFGAAENLARARNVSVAGVAEAGILRCGAGRVRLLQRDELEQSWDPAADQRLCIWEATQHLIRQLEAGGEAAAASLLGQLKAISGHGDLTANCRALAYRLYYHCEKTKQAEEARAYNGLVIAWPELERLLAASQAIDSALQTTLV